MAKIYIVDSYPGESRVVVKDPSDRSRVYEVTDAQKLFLENTQEVIDEFYEMLDRVGA